MKFSNKLCFFSIITLVILSSCTKKPDVEYTPTYKMSGEWFIRYFTGTTPATGYHKIISYNTADPSGGQIWVDALNFQAFPTKPFKGNFKGKFDVDYPSMVFKAATGIPNLASTTGKTIKVLEGKVLPGAGKSKTGVTVDSIYLKLEFSDEPGTVYDVAGHQRTGFQEDEY
jgi:hypothetical protein